MSPAPVSQEVLQKVKAAEASMAYWSAPLGLLKPARQSKLPVLEQMFAYYG